MRLSRCAALVFCATIALAGIALLPRVLHPAAVVSPACTAAPPEEPGAQETLFPALDPSSIVSVRVSTPERTFDFRTDEAGVSVNGQIADAEAFSTLIAQIAALPVLERDSFLAEGAPLLTLTVQSKSGRMAASFYRDESSESYARVVCASDGAQQYRRTKTWQVGKLLLTCDGTRIQDETGRETPAQ